MGEDQPKNANFQDGQVHLCFRASPAHLHPAPPNKPRQARFGGQVHSAPSLSLEPLSQEIVDEGLFKSCLHSFFAVTP
ncbi:hypothetical protein PAL_GLEAN10012829 [Pteropus alecto]|uniref:Uncharacterized protein n=1 Tax=Pteropus alecto TaxID=9402 RepID=L5L4M4_PTEAL|nr:hypothetical protein PAL_GLEAN10012829 [Pteropus alecto]